MLIVRDFVAHMANEVVKRLVEGGQIETKGAAAVANRVRQRMLEELTVEDRLNDEVRQILIDHQDVHKRNLRNDAPHPRKNRTALAPDH